MTFHFEEWRPVPSQPRWEASSFGRVRPLPKNGGPPRSYAGSYGYKKKSHKNASQTYRRASDELTGKHYKVHRLVCEAFHGPAPFPGAIVMHLDDDGENNRPENLRWGTQKENLNMPRFIELRRQLMREQNARRNHEQSREGDS